MTSDTAAEGLFVAFEGVDGAGKSTQLRRAAERLRETGRRVVETREPGGSKGAEEIRKLLVSGEAERWSAETELLLFTAARRDHLERVIAPALTTGAVVLCDRFIDSTRAYQVSGRGADREAVETLHRLMIGREPDLVLILDLDPTSAERRGVAPAEDRYERFGADFQSRLREAFRTLAAEAPERRKLIDADRPEEAVAADIAAAIDAALAGGAG